MASAIKVRQRAVRESARMAPLVEGYQRLSVDEVLIDLPCLDRAQLLFVKSLEELAGRRSLVLDRIAELLDILEEAIEPVMDIRAARRRRRRIRPSARTVAVLVAIAIGCGGAVAERGRLAQAMAVVSPGPRLTPTSTGAAIPPDGIAATTLDALLVRAVPVGYTEEPAAGADTAQSELIGAVMDDSTAGARSFLTKAGFVHHVKRIWQTGDHHQLTVSIFQFQDPAGASADQRRWATNLRSNLQATVTSFGVGAIPGAVGLTQAISDSVTATVSFTKADYYVQVSVNWYVATGLEGTAQAVAHDQRGLL